MSEEEGLVTLDTTISTSTPSVAVTGTRMAAPKPLEPTMGGLGYQMNIPPSRRMAFSPEADGSSKSFITCMSGGAQCIASRNRCMMATSVLDGSQDRTER